MVFSKEKLEEMDYYERLSEKTLTLTEAREIVRNHPHLWSKADLENVETTLRQLWGVALPL
jgi:hypothetical protein